MSCLQEAQTSPLRMSSTSSMFLIFGLLFSISNLNLSTGQKWEAFKRNHIASSPVITCAVAMHGDCSETHSFIHTSPRILENICKNITGRKNISSYKEFTVSTCKNYCNTSCTCGEAEVQRGLICLTCRNRKPVQFVKMGRC